VQDGDLVWTRDRSGGYFLGLVDGGWRYDGSDEAERWDLNNVTKMIYERESNPGRLASPIDPEEIISELLDPIDVEDIVLLFLQADGWLLLPSSRMNDTPLYEAALRNRDGRVAVVAVKSGANNVVPVRELSDAADEDVQVLSRRQLVG
jgi:hypothetical protein